MLLFHAATAVTSWMLLSFSSCLFLWSPAVVSAQDETIYELAASNSALTTLTAALNADSNGAATVLDSPGSYTVLAPTDDAFASVDPDLLGKLLTPEWNWHLFLLLLDHVVPGEVLSSDLMDGMEVATLSISELEVSIPSSGGPVMIGPATVLIPNVLASNGVVHVVDTVIVADEFTQTIYQQGSMNDDFSVLVSLVDAAGLTDALNGPGPMTLFAPSNDAFSKLDPDLVATLTDPANVDMLTQVLLYHVVAGNEYISKLNQGRTMVPTLQGESVAIKVPRGANRAPRVNGIPMNAWDIPASNGVLVLIDTVLIPPSMAMPSSASASSASASSASASSASASVASASSASASSASASSASASSASASSSDSSSSDSSSGTKASKKKRSRLGRSSTSKSRGGYK